MRAGGAGWRRPICGVRRWCARFAGWLWWCVCRRGASRTLLTRLGASVVWELPWPAAQRLRPSGLWRGRGRWSRRLRRPVRSRCSYLTQRVQALARRARQAPCRQVRTARCVLQGARERNERTATAMARTENVTVGKTGWGTELRCAAGQVLEPFGCERHQTHHFCTACAGWYGVPHDRIHSGPSAHPRGGGRDCACRPCREAESQLLARQAGGR